VLRSPGGFQPIINLWPIKRNIPPKTNAITAASTLPSSPFDEGHIDMAWVERTDPIRYEDHLLERSTRTVIDSFLAVAPYMIDSDSRSGFRAPSSCAS
jgi:hypothetical protein